MNGTATKDDVLGTLTRLHAAQQANDVEAMLRLYSAHGFVDARRMRAYFEGLVEQDAFRTRTVDMSQCETFIHRDSALVKPVIYHTAKGLRSFSFHFDKEDDGTWRIVDNNRSQLPGAPVYNRDLLADAGKVVGSRGMLWIRRLQAPIDDVWRAISTKEGLDQWWLTGSVELDLRPGGVFKHHWSNTVADFATNRFIDFAGTPQDQPQFDNLMRFQLESDGTGTVFYFFDSFQGHQRPLSLPWTASGWHATVDALETLLTGREYDKNWNKDFKELSRFLDTCLPEGALIHHIGSTSIPGVQLI